MYGKYVVSNCTVAQVQGSEHEFCFSVTPPKGKQMLFAALSEDDMAEWMKVLSGDVRQAGDEENVGSKVLGVPLERVRYTDEIGLPIFLTCLLTYIEATALGMEELFTKPPDPVLISQIEEGELDFELIKDPHAVAGLIQLFLRELPQPVCTADLHDCFVGVYEVKNEEIQVQALVGLVNCLPPLHYNLLFRLLSFLSELQNNGSDALATHLANTFSVLLLRAPKNPSRPLDLKYEKLAVTAVTKLLIEHWQSIIPEPLEIEEQNLFSDEEFPLDDEYTPRALSDAEEEEEVDAEEEEDNGEPVASPPVGLSKKEQKMREKAEKERQKQEEKERKRHEKEGKKKAQPATDASPALNFMSKKEMKKREKAIREAEKKMERERREQERKLEKEKKAAETTKRGLLSPRKKKDSLPGDAPEAKEEVEKEEEEKKTVVEEKKTEKKKKEKEEEDKEEKKGEKEEEKEPKKEKKKEKKEDHEEKKKEHKKKDKKTDKDRDGKKKKKKKAEKVEQKEAQKEEKEDQDDEQHDEDEQNEGSDKKAPAAAAIEKATGEEEAEAADEATPEEKSEPSADKQDEKEEAKEEEEEEAAKEVEKEEEEEKEEAGEAKATAASAEGEATATEAEAADDAVEKEEEAAEDGEKDEKEGEGEEGEEGEGEEPTVLAQAPVSDRMRLVGPQKGRVVGPKRRRPTRGQPVTIATTTFYVPETEAAPKPKPLTPQQQMMMEMARVIKRK